MNDVTSHFSPKLTKDIENICVVAEINIYIYDSAAQKQSSAAQV